MKATKATKSTNAATKKRRKPQEYVVCAYNIISDQGVILEPSSRSIAYRYMVALRTAKNTVAFMRKAY